MAKQVFNQPQIPEAQMLSNREDQSFKPIPPMYTTHSTVGHAANQALRREVVPEKFHGTTPWPDYHLHFEMCADLNNWGEEAKAKHLAVALRGNAQRILKNLLPKERSNYASLVQKLEERFGTEGQSEMFKAKLLNRKKSSKESYQELADNIGDLVQKAYPSASADMLNSLTLERFTEAITDHDVKIHIKTSKVSNVREAAVRACEIDAIYAAEGVPTKLNTKKVVQEINVANAEQNSGNGSHKKGPKEKAKGQAKVSQVSQPKSTELENALSALTQKLEEMNGRMKALENPRHNPPENQNFAPHYYEQRQFSNGPRRGGRGNFRPRYNRYQNNNANYNYAQNRESQNPNVVNQSSNFVPRPQTNVDGGQNREENPSSNGNQGNC